MKKVLTFMICLILFTNTYVFAQENTLKLEDVLKRVETNSSITLIGHNIIRLDNLYKTTKDIVTAIPIGLQAGLDSQTKANMGFPFTKKDMLAQDKFVFISPNTILQNNENLKRTKQVAVNTLKLKAEELFNGILLSDEGINLQQEVLDVSSLKLKMSQEKYNQGLISKNDLDKIKIEVNKNKLALEKQKRLRLNLEYTLNKLMGVKLNNQYSIVGKISDPLDFDFNADINKIIETAIKNRQEVIKINDEIKAAEEELFFTKIYYLPEEPEYITAEIKIENVKEQLRKASDEISSEIEDAYEMIMQNYINIEKTKIDLENANKKYNDLKEKYSAGLITKDILDSVHLGISSADVSLKSAFNTYNMSVKKFNAALGLGPKFN